MDNRQKQLLKVIVETYVKSVKPVGSKSLCEKFNLSSATIRNEMAILEDLGYIEKNHISSGRIPSEKGYRYYVENLMEPEKLNGSEMLKLQRVVKNQDLVSNAKKHRSALNDYTVGIARAILLLGRLLFGVNTDENDEIQLTNKDGFLVSDEELQEQYRQDFQAGLMSKLTYLMKARGMTKEQAMQELALVRKDNPSIKDLIGE